MRVISGIWRNHKIIAPQGNTVRPTADRARQMIFNVVENSGLYSKWPIKKATFLDLFAGTGAVGIEALSRGAGTAIFIDNSRTSVAAVDSNVKSIGAEKKSIIIQADALNPGPPRATSSIVFLDPPYQYHLSGKALTSLSKTKWFEAGALIIVETSKNDLLNLPSAFDPIEQRNCGNARFWFYVFLGLKH